MCAYVKRITACIRNTSFNTVDCEQANVLKEFSITVGSIVIIWYTYQPLPENIDPGQYLHVSKADLAHIADSILFCVDLGADPPPAAPGLDDWVGRRGGHLVIM